MHNHTPHKIICVATYATFISQTMLVKGLQAIYSYDVDHVI